MKNRLRRLHHFFVGHPYSVWSGIRKATCVECDAEDYGAYNSVYYQENDHELYTGGKHRTPYEQQTGESK